MSLTRRSIRKARRNPKQTENALRSIHNRNLKLSNRRSDDLKERGFFRKGLIFVVSLFAFLLTITILGL